MKQNVSHVPYLLLLFPKHVKSEHVDSQSACIDLLVEECPLRGGSVSLVGFNFTFEFPG